MRETPLASPARLPDATSILSELKFKAVRNAALARPELLMSRAAKPIKRDLNQGRHAQNGPPPPGSKIRQNASQAQFSSIAEILEDVLTGIGASTDDAAGPVRITGNDPYVASPHRLAAMLIEVLEDAGGRWKLVGTRVSRTNALTRCIAPHPCRRRSG